MKILKLFKQVQKRSCCFQVNCYNCGNRVVESTRVFINGTSAVGQQNFTLVKKAGNCSRYYNISKFDKL